MSALMTAVEKAMMVRSVADLHPVPPITEPMGKWWEQPSRFDIEIDSGHALMTQETFDALHDYSHSQPSGVYPGKMWRAHYRLDGWWLHWFGETENPKMCSNNSRRILIA